jgi:hypothetical protein
LSHIPFSNSRVARLHKGDRVIQQIIENGNGYHKHLILVLYDMSITSSYCFCDANVVCDSLLALVTINKLERREGKFGDSDVCCYID